MCDVMISRKNTVLFINVPFYVLKIGKSCRKVVSIASGVRQREKGRAPARCATLPTHVMSVGPTTTHGNFRVLFRSQLYSGAHGTPSRVPLINAEQQQQRRRWKRGEADGKDRRRQQAAAAAMGTSTPPAIPAAKRRNNAAPPGVPVTLVLLVLLGYICLGAAVFAAWEGWSFIDGAYFCFVTLSTIGFGDLVPGKSFQGTDTQNGQLQLVACCGYLLFGLVLIAMSFSLVQEEVVSKCRHVARNVGLLKQPSAQPYAL